MSAGFGVSTVGVPHRVCARLQDAFEFGQWIQLSLAARLRNLRLIHESFF